MNIWQSKVWKHTAEKPKPNDALYGIARDVWPGLIHATLVAMTADEFVELWKVKSDDLPVHVMEYWEVKGYTERDMTALSTMQSPSGVAQLLAEGIFWRYTPLTYAESNL